MGYAAVCRWRNHIGPVLALHHVADACWRGLAHAAHGLGASAHRSARQQAHDCGLVHALLQRLVQRLVLQDLFEHRLRQFLQHALGERALQDAAHKPLLSAGMGLACGDHRVDVVDAHALRHLLAHALEAHGLECVTHAWHATGNASAQHRKASAARARGTSQSGLLAGQQPVLGPLADLLGGAAGHDRALTDRSGSRSAHALEAQAHDGTAQYTTSAHGGQRLHDAVGDSAGVGQSRDAGVYKAVGVLDGLERRLLRVAVLLIEELLGLGGSKAQALRRAPRLATRGEVR